MRDSYIPICVVLAALFTSTIYLYRHESSFLKPMAITSGTVAAHGNRSIVTTTINGVSTTRGNQALVDFFVGGTRYRAEGRAMGRPSWQLGQVVDVYYLPSDPKVSRISRTDEAYFFTLLSGFFLVAMLLCAAINFAFRALRNRRKRDRGVTALRSQA